LIREADLLQSRDEALQATPQERQRLLELLVGLERQPEAIALLEKLADREPQQWSLRLMLAELRRDQGDRRGAERELRQILHQRPTQMEALQLMALVLLEQGKGAEAEALIKAAYTASSKPPAKARPDTAITNDHMMISQTAWDRPWFLGGFNGAGRAGRRRCRKWRHGWHAR
jgi:predicted Zn-dependent protease